MRLEDLMKRAAQYDEKLARDISDYVNGRTYGLVYEASKPEFVRMWNKPIIRGDIVNILPPRGVMEDMKSEDDPSEAIYRVIAISDGVASLRNEQTEEIATASIDDIVAVARFDKPIYAGLKEMGRVERGGNKPYHVVINGENYHALQVLVYAYQGQVDCIYIDPPYNTGATDWKYNNNYVSKDNKYRHSKWLTFMEDRIRLAKKLLNPKDSVLIVTIDEKEYLRLGLLLEQLFPEANIQMVSTVINFKGSSRKDSFARSGEYVYFVMVGESCPKALPLEKEWLGNITATSRKKLRLANMMRFGDNGKRKRAPNCFYPIFLTPDGKRFVGVGDPLPLEKDRNSIKAPPGAIAQWPIHLDGSEGCWGYSKDSLLKLIEKGYLHIGKSYKYGFSIMFIQPGWQKRIENGSVRIIGHYEDGFVKTDSSGYVLEFVPGDNWAVPSHNATEHGMKLLKKFIGKRFPFPKSLYAVKDCINFFLSTKPNALVLDFFAGSGTTMHAVNLLNAEDDGQRKCILVTNNEVSEEEEKNMTLKGLRPTDEEWKNFGIAHYITWPRTICSIEGRNVEGNKLKGKYLGCGFPMASGFKENAVFFDLEYLEPSIVGADLAFDRIAPILWLAGGCVGEILRRQKGYVIGETYAILFDPRYKSRFVDEVERTETIKKVFIITEIAESYRSLCAELPRCRVSQLYESYLRSFEINAIG